MEVQRLLIFWVCRGGDLKLTNWLKGQENSGAPG